MKRREFIQLTAGLGLAAHPAMGVSAAATSAMIGGTAVGLKGPVFVYNNWSAYDELSDKVVQTEELAMRELGEVVRLKKSGVRLDYYVMDAFWFDKMGGYRIWHKEHWPNGPDRWLRACKDNGILPGMWFSTNLIATHEGRFLEPVPEWKDSVGTDSNILSLFEGGYLTHLGNSLQLWYDRGVRLFKFDFAYFEAVTTASKDKFTADEIKEKNKTAFMGMLRRFRDRNADVLITGYNGFGGDMENTFTPFRKTVDPRWLDVFDTLYSGDPRMSDVPMMNIWRSQDNYSDHMVRQFAFNGLPLRRIDSCAFMIGKTGTCYYRGTHAWKGMLLLELARGGWMNVYHGNLELLDGADAQWFARAQGMYLDFLEVEGVSAFGAVPGSGKPYGFKGVGKRGVVYTVVNPSQEVGSVELGVKGRILYADGGFKPVIRDGSLSLGSEQLVVVGMGEYAEERYELGRDESIQIPAMQQRIDVDLVRRGKNKVGAMVRALPGKDLRILFQQVGADGLPVRSWGGAPPDGRKMNELLTITVRQDGAVLPLVITYDKMIWSGLSWAAGELRQKDFGVSRPVDVECFSAEKDELTLNVWVYAVGY